MIEGDLIPAPQIDLSKMLRLEREKEDIINKDPILKSIAERIRRIESQTDGVKDFNLVSFSSRYPRLTPVEERHLGNLINAGQETRYKLESIYDEDPSQNRDPEIQDQVTKIKISKIALDYLISCNLRLVYFVVE